MYNENYKTLLKEINKDINKWKQTHPMDVKTSWIGKLNIVKMSILPKGFHRLIAIPIKILKLYFAEIEKSIIKFIWNLKEP